MNRILVSSLLACLLSGAASGQQRWELGFSGGYGWARQAKVSTGAAEISAGVAPGPAFSIYAGNQVRRWLQGEARYTFRIADLRLSGNGASPRFDARTHALHYDLLFLGGREGGIQPFVAAGAGIRLYQGVGTETRSQALNRFAVLSKTSDLRALLSVGAGIRVPLSRLVALRLEFRDLITPFPGEVIAPVPGARTSGWIHDFVPLVGVGFRF